MEPVKINQLPNLGNVSQLANRTNVSKFPQTVNVQSPGPELENDDDDENDDVNFPQLLDPASSPQLPEPINVHQSTTPVPQLVTPNILLPSSGCFWSGTAPFCSPACGKKYHSVFTDSKGDGKSCWTGHKKFCCPLADIKSRAKFLLNEIIKTSYSKNKQ